MNFYWPRWIYGALDKYVDQQIEIKQILKSVAFINDLRSSSSRYYSVLTKARIMERKNKEGEGNAHRMWQGHARARLHF
jgi:hypothetical protein